MISRWLFGAESGRRLLAVHLGLAALVGLRIALGPYGQLAGQPDALFRPVWFLRPLSGMPPLAVIVILQVVGTALAVVALAPRYRWRRVAFVAAWACLMVLAGLRASRGKVLHNDVLLLLACVPFLAAPAVDDPRDRTESRRYGWPIRTAMVVVAGAYFFAGFHKLVQSGLAWVTSDNVENVLVVAARSGRLMFPEAAEFLSRQAVMAHVLGATILLLEVTFPVVLFSARARPFYAAAAAAFHAGTWLLLGIDYWLWAAVTPLVLVDLAAGRRRRPDPGPRAEGRGRLPARRAWAGTPAGPGSG
ncbi:MAG: HTTM domain-containing protein [Acidimicrobiales bacterium]